MAFSAFIDLVEIGFISVRKGGHGELRFGAINLHLDWVNGDDDKAEFSFEGFDELDEVSGRGWVKIVTGRLTGLIRFYQGEESRFKAEPWSASEQLKRKTSPEIMKATFEQARSQGELPAWRV